jgi:FkbM family methyltransferase
MFKKIIKKFNNKFRKFYGLHEMDRLMLEFINYNNGFFIEIGANDGINQSNTLHYEKFKKWRGILIEPNYNNFLKLKKNRSHENHFFNNACVSIEYKNKFVEFDYLNLMSFAKNLDNDIQDIKNFYSEGIRYLPKGEKKHFFKSESITLQKAMNLSNAPKLIDFFSLDVEGTEIEVLKGINFDEYKFKYILIESRNLDKTKEFLKNKKYTFVKSFSNIDFLFKGHFY